MAYTWTDVTTNTGVSDATFQSIACDSTGSKLIVTTSGAGSSGEGIIRSTDGGATWSKLGIDADSLCCASSSDGTILAVGRHIPSSRVLLSTNSGTTWSVITVGTSSRINSLSMSGDGSIMVAGDGSSTDKKLYISTNTGVSFAASAAFGTGGWPSAKVSRDGSTIYAAGAQKLLKSTDNGATVTDVTPPALSGVGGGDICCSSNGSVVIIAGFNGKQYVSINAGSTWTDKGNSPDSHTGDNASMNCSDNGAVIFYASFDAVAMQVSTDTDTNWSAQTTSTAGWNYTCVSADGSKGGSITTNSNNKVWVASSSSSGGGSSGIWRRLPTPFLISPHS